MIRNAQLRLLDEYPNESAWFEYDASQAAPCGSAPPVLSFFSGAGFLDLGFEQAGFPIVWRNEVNAEFASASRFAYRSMHGTEIDIEEESIVDLGPKSILRAAFADSEVPEHFGIIGGPPCPDFSIGGKNRGGTGDRGKLTEVYCNRILELQPSFFVLENVRGLLSTRKHRRFLDYQLARLKNSYATSLRVLNAIDVGVPQDRERVFVIGLLKRWLRKNGRRVSSSAIRWPRSTAYFGAKEKYDWPSTSPFGRQVELPHGIPVELTVWGAIGGGKELRDLPNGEDYFRPKSKKFSVIAEGDDRRKSFKRLHRWRYSPTVAYGNNEVHLHPTEPRRITVREAMRLQSVPDTYAFPPEQSLSAKFKMVGNGVPVRLAHAVATAVRMSLDGANE